VFSSGWRTEYILRNALSSTSFVESRINEVRQQAFSHTVGFTHGDKRPLTTKIAEGPLFGLFSAFSRVLSGKIDILHVPALPA